MTGGQDWADWDSFAEDMMDEECGRDDEPVGSCDDCGTNLYPEDDVALCDQCLWRRKRFLG